MIRWCLYLRHQSSKAYETLRQSGCFHLPSQHTLHDYSHSVKAGAGFSMEVDCQLRKAINMESCPEWHKLVILLLDEMSIKENLVYDKHTGEMTGFVDLGDANNQMLVFQHSIERNDVTPVLANSMMVVIVRGIFTKLRYPYALFPSPNISGELLFQPFWNAIFRLERMELKVGHVLYMLLTNIISKGFRSHF